ncbi:hypothetical protein GCK72_025544 [Caenorhabditis remanei]|uniref:MEIS N-terminal domain-containing protein n=1 Tax=Caenorhabditis remanei TaxID=31234 RepID=A0A6A5G297_CAERE|nr:hypothetical protein GCK72_025544 [Caenorhabditis remanei]KAF1749077.1 hypothetical protein GCK72_025544 [Caenorhabditis remanei]
MTSEPSTSSESLDAEKSALIQEALTKAGVIKIQKQSVSPPNIKNLKKSIQFERIAEHPLMPVVELLLKKCEDAATTYDRAPFEMEDVEDPLLPSVVALGIVATVLVAHFEVLLQVLVDLETVEPGWRPYSHRSWLTDPPAGRSPPKSLVDWDIALVACSDP